MRTVYLLKMAIGFETTQNLGVLRRDKGPDDMPSYIDNAMVGGRYNVPWIAEGNLNHSICRLVHDRASPYESTATGRRRELSCCERTHMLALRKNLSIHEKPCTVFVTVTL